MRHISRHIVIFILVLAGAAAAQSQVFGLDRHTVTVQVLPVTQVQIIGGGVSLDIDNASAVAGQDMMTVTDQSSSIHWATNSANRKITVATDLATPLFALRLLAVGASQGTSMAEVELSTTAKDLLLNIGRTTGSATLRYTGIAYASQGTGIDNHVITFTIQSQ